VAAPRRRVDALEVGDDLALRARRPPHRHFVDPPLERRHVKRTLAPVTEEQWRVVRHHVVGVDRRHGAHLDTVEVKLLRAGIAIDHCRHFVPDSWRHQAARAAEELP
jgi:hypothetical protein